MSLGYGGFAALCLQDENTVLYSYGVFNLNIPGLQSLDRAHDGLITIRKDLLDPVFGFDAPQPQTRRKKKDPKKKHKTAIDFDLLSELIKNGTVQTENSRFCWRISENGIGYVAKALLFRILLCYRDHGAFPESAGCHW